MATFLKELFWAFDIFKESLCISRVLLQSSFLWSRVSVFVTERVAVVHSPKDNIFILKGDLAVIHCLLEQFFSNSMFISKKKVGFSYAFLQRYYKEYSQPSILSTVYFSDVKICSHPLLLNHFLSVYLRTPVTVKETSPRSSYIFTATPNILKREQSHEVATFSQKDFFRTPSCPEELLLSNNYFLVTNTFLIS